jgi:hypothetical protein
VIARVTSHTIEQRLDPSGVQTLAFESKDEGAGRLPVSTLTIVVLADKPPSRCGALL